MKWGLLMGRTSSVAWLWGAVLLASSVGAALLAVDAGLGWQSQSQERVDSYELQSEHVLLQTLAVAGSIDGVWLGARQPEILGRDCVLFFLPAVAVPASLQEMQRQSMARVELRIHHGAEQIYRPLPQRLRLRPETKQIQVGLQCKAGREPVRVSLTPAGAGPRAVELRPGLNSQLVARELPAPLDLRLVGHGLPAWRGLGVGLLFLSLFAACVAIIRQSLHRLHEEPSPRSPWLAHDPALPSSRHLDRIARWVLVFAAGLAVAVSPAVGMTWDEPYQAAYGQFLYEYFTRWFPDAGVVDHYHLFNLYRYGGLFELTLVLADKLSPLPALLTRHLLTAALAWLGLLFTWRLGRRVGGARLGLLALLALLGMPVWVGHAFNNSKDMPFAVGCLLLVLGSTRFYQHLPKPRGSDVWILLSGLCLVQGVRFLGGAALALPLVMLLLWAGRQGARWRWVGPLIAGVMVPVAVFSTALALLTWPWAQANPLSRALGAFGFSLRFVAYTEPVLFAGSLVPAQQIPRFYLPWMMALKIPVLVSALALLACALWLWQALLGRGPRRPEWLLLAPMVALLLGPPLLALLTQPVLYDGIRHALFTLPFAALLAAWMLDWLLCTLSAWARLGLVVLASAHFVYVGVTIALLHPYSYIFYSLLAGGVPGAENHYELDYWGASYQQALWQLDERLRQGGWRPDPQRPVAISSCAPAMVLGPILPLGFTLVDDSRAQFFVASTRARCHDRLDGEAVVEVRRLGALLAEVKQVRR